MKILRAFFTTQWHTFLRIKKKIRYTPLILLMMIFSLILTNIVRNLLFALHIPQQVNLFLLFVLKLYCISLVLNALNLVVNKDELSIVNKIKNTDINYKLLQLGVIYYLFKLFVPNKIMDVIELTMIVFTPTIEVLYQEQMNGFRSVQKAIYFLKDHFFEWVLSNLPIAFLIVFMKSYLPLYFPIIAKEITKLLTLLLIMIIIGAILLYRAHLYDVINDETKAKRMLNHES